MRAGLGLNRPMAIFVSHIHADHVIGLPGLLLRMSLLGRQRPLEIFGPKELIEYVRMTRDSIGLGTTFETTVYAVDEGRLWGHNGLSVRAFPVKHRGLALGFEVTYQRPRGKFHPERAEALGVPRGPLWHNLAMGKAVEIDGRRIEPHEVSDPPPSPLKIVYTGDTRPCESLLEAATGAEVLISEAMYASDKVDLAQERGHMTAREAAELAAEADVKLLVLTHYSPRYDLERGATILNEARELFSNTILAHDLMRIEVTWQGAHVVASRQYS